MSDMQRRGREGMGPAARRLGAVSLMLAHAALVGSASLLAQSADAGSVVVLFTVLEEPTVATAAPAGSVSIAATLSELRNERPRRDPTRGRMVTADVAAAIDALPLVTATEFDVLLDSTPRARRFAEERGEEAWNCGVAQQLAMLRGLDFVLCGGIRPHSGGGFEIAMFAVAMDPREEAPLVEARVDDLGGVTRHAVAVFQEWASQR